MALHTSPISRNLKTSIRLMGLDVEDLLVVGLAAVGMLIVGQFVFPHDMVVMGLPMNWFCFLMVVAIGVPGLMIFKYGKPRGYLKDFLNWHLKPRSYSPFGRDSKVTCPYLAELADDPPSKDAGRKPNA